jgi:hypothetical protein
MRQNMSANNLSDRGSVRLYNLTGLFFPRRQHQALVHINPSSVYDATKSRGKALPTEKYLSIPTAIVVKTSCTFHSTDQPYLFRLARRSEGFKIWQSTPVVMRLVFSELLLAAQHWLDLAFVLFWLIEMISLTPMYSKGIS